MYEQKQAAGPADTTKVDLGSGTNVNYWTRSLGVSEQSLRAAVERVGVLPGDVRAELRRLR